MVSTPFHVKCRYTNKLICFCAHGNQRLGSGKGEDRGGALREEEGDLLDDETLRFRYPR